MGNLRLRQVALLGQWIWKASLGIMSVISLLPRFLMGFTLICLGGLFGYSFLLETKDDWLSSWLREKELEFVKDVSEGVKSLSKDMYLLSVERPERIHQYLVEANVEFVTPELIFTQIKQQELLDFLAENPHLTEADFHLPEQYWSDYQRYRQSQKEGTYEYKALPEHEGQVLKLPEYARGMSSSFYTQDVFRPSDLQIALERAKDSYMSQVQAHRAHIDQFIPGALDSPVFKEQMQRIANRPQSSFGAAREILQKSQAQKQQVLAGSENAQAQSDQLKTPNAESAASPQVDFSSAAATEALNRALRARNLPTVTADRAAEQSMQEQPEISQAQDEEGFKSLQDLIGSVTKAQS